jgi:hypothetical protein
MVIVRLYEWIDGEPEASAQTCAPCLELVAKHCTYLVERKERIASSLFPSSRETDEIAEAVFLQVQPELGGGASRTTFIFVIIPRLHSPSKRPPSLQVVKLLTTQVPLLQILEFTPPFFVPSNLRKAQTNLLQARLCTASVNYSSA